MDVPYKFVEINDAEKQSSLNSFLASVERRAFLMARTALGNHEDALDAVQDAMLTLASKYAHKDDSEWRPLFFKILYNRINDFHRKGQLRQRFTGLLSFFSGDNEVTGDPIEQVSDAEHNNPAVTFEQSQSMEQLNDALSLLPNRQQQAFMLRCWEGFSTTETATLMKCSEGSVKTHYHRALKTLKNALKEYRDERP